MPNLFPDSDYTDDTSSSSSSTTSDNNSDAGYKGSYKFDFNKGEFVKNPDGTIKSVMIWKLMHSGVRWHY